MKKLTLCIGIILVTLYLAGCNPRFQHEDQFYNDSGEFTYLRFPLIKPYYMDRLDGKSPWVMSSLSLWAPPPNATYLYRSLRDVRNLSVKNGVIMVYSPYVDEQVDQSIREKYFHWFVVVPDKNIEVGFENEGAFLEYIQQFGIQQPDWLEPNDIYKEFAQTGCLDWIPDCK